MKPIMNIKPILLITYLFLINDATAQIGRFPLSPFQTINQTIGVTDIELTYSRPSMRGRTIFGDLVPHNKLWRTGANRNTTIEFSQDVILGGKRIEQGKYAVFSIPTEKQCAIILYNDTSANQ
mgnify:CR=1 FL=1